jgi:fido (protein-threonine AMPylation protein)
VVVGVAQFRLFVILSLHAMPIAYYFFCCLVGDLFPEMSGQDSKSTYTALLKDKLSKRGFKTIEPSYLIPPNTPIDPGPQLCQIISMHFQIKARLRQLSSESVNAVTQALFSSYILEIWLSEFPPSPGSKLDTEAIISSIFEKKDITDSLVTAFGVSKAPQVATQLLNLHATSSWLFGENFMSPRNYDFDIDLVTRVHGRVSTGFLDDKKCGAFRDVPVKASGSTIMYALPASIKSRLMALLDLVRKEQKAISTEQNPQTRLERTFWLAAFFFSEFLIIHPFVDCNGRTARLLTSFLLCDVTVIPFSMYWKSRELYIQVLEDRNNQSTPPTALATYVLCCAEKTCSDVLFLSAGCDDDRVPATPPSPGHPSSFSFPLYTAIGLCVVSVASKVLSDPCPITQHLGPDPCHDEEFCGIVAKALVEADRIKLELGINSGPKSVS